MKRGSFSDESGRFFGGGGPDQSLLPLSFFRLFIATKHEEENAMIFHDDRAAGFQTAGLERALADTGLSLDDIEVLLECELDTTQVLEYISAVRRNRMN